MKKIILTFLLLVITFNFANSQTEMAKGLNIISARSSIELTNMKYSKDLADDTPDLVQAFTNYIDTVKKKDAIIISNKEQIKKALNEINSVYVINKFPDIVIKTKENFDIVTPLPYLNSQKAIIFSTLIYTNVFNTINMNNIDRASKITQDVAIPFLSKISEYFANNQYIGVSIAYGSEDFSKKYRVSMNDVLIVIVDAKSAKQFYNMEISEDEFIGKCNFYAIDGQASDTSLKKISLKL